MTQYDDTNIFAKIFETYGLVAIMDVMPQSEGHCLVIPKTASRNLLDADDAVLHEVILAVAKLARAAKQAFEADGVSIMQFNEAAGGQSVFHLHFHVIPRYEGTALRPHGSSGMADPAVLAEQAERIRAHLA